MAPPRAVAGTKLNRGGITARHGDQPRAEDSVAINLRQPIDSIGNKLGACMTTAVPALPVGMSFMRKSADKSITRVPRARSAGTVCIATACGVAKKTTSHIPRTRMSGALNDNASGHGGSEIDLPLTCPLARARSPQQCPLRLVALTASVARLRCNLLRQQFLP